MKKRMKKVVSWLLAFTMVLGLSACQGTQGREMKEGNSPEMATTVTTDGQDTIKAAGETVGISVRDTLNVGYNYDQYTTPWRSSSASAVSLANLYDTLYTYDENMDVVPQLAESCEISNDGLEYTIKLKQGVLFHNGEEMTSEDVAWSLNFAYENGDAGKALLSNFDHAEEVDKYTVKITLTAPFAAFLNCLSTRTAYIADKSHFDAIGGTIDAYETDPVGCGQYKLAGREVGASTTLEAFDDYWNGPAPIKHVCIKYISDANTQMIALESGEIDAMITPQLNSLVMLDNDKIEWIWGNSASRIYIQFNIDESKVTSDVNLRKAMQSLIKRQDILNAVNEGYGEIADICIPSGYTARPTDYHVAEENVEKAKEYLAASSYNGEKLTLIVPSGTSNEKAANIFQAQCYELGINVEINPLDISTFSEVQKAGEYNIMVHNALSSLVDADLMHSMFGPSASGNWHQYADQLNKDCEEGRCASSMDDRIAAYTDLVNLVTDEALEITCFYDVVTVAYNKDLAGVKIHMLKMFDFGTWYWKD